MSKRRRRITKKKVFNIEFSTSFVVAKNPNFFVTVRYKDNVSLDRTTVLWDKFKQLMESETSK